MNEKNFNPIPLDHLVPGLTRTPFERDDLTRTSFRPTLVVGIGGTGLLAVRRIKSLLPRYFKGEEMGVFQFVVFDTAAQEVPEGEEPLDAGEFVYLPPFDAADLVRHLRENPFILKWWPGGLKRPYQPVFSGTGSNRVRPVGRLVFQTYLSSKILPRLEAKINRAIEINAQHGMGATSLKIYLICSLAGGTGSGMVVDMAYILRMLGLRNQPTTYLTGHLVMDDAFLPKAHTENTRAEMRANTYQALRELDFFNRTRHFHEEYDDITSTRELPDGFRPFDITYLLGLHNAEGQAIESLESLIDMIAAEVMLEIASPLHGKAENILDNVRANDRSIAGCPAAYSSYALSSLVVPVEGIASWCALSTYPEFVQRVLLTPRRPASEVPSEVTGFMHQVGIEQDQSNALVEQLARGPQGEALSTPALSHDQVDGLPDERLMGTLQRLEELALSTLNANRQAVAERVQLVQKEFTAAMHQRADELLRDPQRGPQYLVWFLAEMAGRLQSQRERLTGEQAGLRADMDAYAAAWSSASSSIAQVLRFPSWLPLRSSQLRNARRAYVAALNAYLDSVQQLECRVQAVVSCSAFLQEIQAVSSRQTSLLGSMQSLAQTCADRAKAESVRSQATETDYSLMCNIVSRVEMGRLLERFQPKLEDVGALDTLAGEFWEFCGRRIPDWSTGSPVSSSGTDDSSPAFQAYYFLADWYGRALMGVSLVEMLRQIYGPSWMREIELRYRQTAPFWNYNLSRFGDKIRNNLQNEPRLVGYGEAGIAEWTTTVSTATGEPVNGVNNKNPHEMVFLKTSHGLPLFALRSLNQTLLSAYRYIHGLWEGAQAGSNPIPVMASADWESRMQGLDLQPEIVTVDAEPSVEPARSGPNGHQPEPESAGKEEA